MRKSEIKTMIDGIGLPAAYSHFSRATNQAPPFICYLYDTDDDFMADNANYVNIVPLVIELYTNVRDFDLEDRIKDVLRSNDLAWTLTPEYIDSEQMHMTTFTMEVVINAEEEQG